MFKNYITSTFRALVREKLYTLINIGGLSIGLATCFLIYTWVRNETSYDRDLPGSDRVYRAVTKWKNTEEPGRATTYPMIRTRVLSQFPEIEVSTRVFDQGFLGTKTRIAYQDKVFTNEKFFYADSTFFDVFPFHFLKGQITKALSKPNAVVLTRSTAEKYFGHEDPVGKILIVGEKQEFEVTAVVQDIPANMHFHFDLLASMQSHPWIKMAEDNVWSGIVFHTYAKLKVNSSPQELEKKIGNFLDHFPNDPKGYGKGLDIHLQPVGHIHLTSAMGFEFEANGNSTYVYLFVSIAVLVLLMAIINYTNLAAARHTKRFKEVGVRKVLGASRKQLVIQFVTESVIITFAAFVLALAVVVMMRPWLPAMAGGLVASSLFQPSILLACIAISLVIGLLTGVSPAFALSAFKPVGLFKANLSASARGITVRKVLMVSQFTVSIALTICTAITYRQLKFLQDARLGYKLDHTIVLNIGYKDVQQKYEQLKSELTGHSGISGATATSQLPTDIQTEENIDITSDHSLGVNFVSVDPDFFKVMGIDVRQGAQLIDAITVSDTINQFVLNESAVKAIGWADDEALNKLMSIRHGNQRRGSVKGIVSDFHFQSLHRTVGPLVLEFNPREYQYLLVRVSGANFPETIDFISQRWATVANGIPFEYSFLDQEYGRLYRSERQTSALFIAFAAMAILISLLGLFGLSSFAVERRTKEIGLRKILGANNEIILLTVSKDFLLLLVISFLLAIIPGYYFMTTWLASFAFKVPIGAGVFLSAGLINIALGFLTLMYQSIRIAETNPVETLRCE